MTAPHSVLAYDKTPEELRGLPPARRPVNWAAFDLVFDAQNIDGGSRFARERIKKNLRKLIEKHGVGVMSPTMRYSYCSARLYLGDFSDWWGWEFRGMYDEGPSRSWAADLYWSETWLPKWGGGRVKNLLVLGEQGIGDQVFYASCLPDVMARVDNVVFECDPRLHRLLERSFPGLRCENERPFEDRRTERTPSAYIPAADMLRVRKHRNDFPGKSYLKPDPARVRDFGLYAGRTGIGWSGRQGRLDALSLGGSGAVSLQWNETHPEIEAPLIDLKDDIDGVVALCSVLERVVCVPSSIHHFAGAAGVKTQIVVPPYGSGEMRTQLPFDYSTAYGGKLPWYPDALVFGSVERWERAERHPSVLA